MHPFSWHVRFEVTIIVENVDRVILVINCKHLPRVEHATASPIRTHKVADLETANRAVVIKCAR